MTDDWRMKQLADADVFLADIESRITEVRIRLRLLRSPDGLRDILAQPVSFFALSIHTENCLKNGNIKTVGDLVSMNRRGLLKIKNLGRTTLFEIEDVLVRHGFSLGMNKP